jgi:hypothetical protein
MTQTLYAHMNKIKKEKSWLIIEHHLDRYMQTVSWYAYSLRYIYLLYVDKTLCEASTIYLSGRRNSKDLYTFISLLS